MIAHAGVSRPCKAEGRAEPRQGRGLESGGNPFPSPNTPEVAEPLERGYTQEESGPLATTKARYDLRSGIARLLKPDDGTRGPAVCGCGFSAYNAEAVAVHMSMETRKASVSGVYWCDSISACPVCTVRRAREVEERLLEAAKACLARGGSVWAMTMTVQRKRGQSLQVMKAGATGALRKARQGSGWTKPSAAAGFMGLTTTTECPWSPRTGHGLHFHILGFFDHRDADRAKGHCELLVTRYLDELDDVGLVGDREAQEMHMCADTESAAKYAAKAAAELAHGWVKESRKGDSVHPFAVAARACLEDGVGHQPIQVPGLEKVSSERAAAAFREYAAVFSGIRQGLISPSLAKKLGIKADEESIQPEDAEQQFENKAPVVGVVDSALWNRLMTRALAGTFLSKVEADIAFDADTGEVVGWSEIIDWAEKATGVLLDHEATRMTERRFERDRDLRERVDYLVAVRGLNLHDAHDTARAEIREEFEAGLYGQDSRGPTIEEMATWRPLYRPLIRVTVSQVWDEAHERAGGLLTHHGSGVGRVMAHVPDAIEAIRARIEARGQEADTPDETEVWASVMERMAA